MNCIPRTKEGGFQHVTSANGDRQGVRLNESEMWIDTLFMTVLFLNKMGQKYQKQEWIDESIHQVLMHIKYLYDTHTGLFYHGWYLTVWITSVVFSGAEETAGSHWEFWTMWICSKEHSMQV